MPTTEVNVRSPISTRKLIYGEAKVGTLVFVSEGILTAIEIFIYAFCFSTHECQSMIKIYIG